MKTALLSVAPSLLKELGLRCLKIVALAGAMGATHAVFAGSHTNSATGNWSADGSWTGGKPAAGGAPDAVIVFNPAGVDNSINDLAGGFTLNRMEFAAGSVTLSGNPLTFTNNGAAGPRMAIAGGSATVISNNIALNSDTVFHAANNITSCGVLSGKGGLIKTGAGTLTCATNSASPHTYSGSTIVSEGTLVISTIGSSGSQSFGSTNITVQGGSTMRVLAFTGLSGWAPPATGSVNVQSNGTLTIDIPAINCGYLTYATGATIDGASACLQVRGADTAGRIAAVFGSGVIRKVICGVTSAGTQTLLFDGTGTGATIGTASGTPLSWRNSVAALVLDIADSPSADVDTTVGWFNVQPPVAGCSFAKQGSGVLQIDGMDFTGGSNPTKPVSCAVGGGTLILNTRAAISMAAT